MKHWWIILVLFCCPISCDIFAAYTFPLNQFDTIATKKIALVTDVHYLSPQLAEEGEALSSFENATGRNTKELHEVLQEVLINLKREAPNILLVTGDLTNHGERLSHLDFIKLLRPLQEAGIRIFVIPGNHDVNIPDARAYKGDSHLFVEGVSSAEFAHLYRDFGYGIALRRDSTSLSYLAEIDEKTWLLAFDSNRHKEFKTSSISAGRILPETKEWALQILHEAKDKGIKVLGMMHHGLVEHMPFQEAFFPDYIVNDWRNLATELADAGLSIIFTGHFHANDITLFTSSAGHKIYDVETASLVQYPFAYRMMKLDGEKISIDTHFITSIPSNANLEEVAYRRLEILTRRAAISKLNRSGLAIPDMVKNNLLEMIVELNLAHVRGDEVLNVNLRELIRSFVEMMGAKDTADPFTFDFLPEDNNVIIRIGEN